MQARPPPQERYVPPTAPGVPIQAMQNLIPRLATAINDIDNLKNQIAMGNADGSMPSWDTLLQRYSMLLGRVQQLSAYIAQEARTGPGNLTSLIPTAGLGAAASASVAARGAPVPTTGRSSGTPGPEGVAPTKPPALAHYFVHPLRPLPPDCGPVAPEVLFQVINTMPLPQLDEAQKGLLKEAAPQLSSFLSLPGQVKLQPLDELQKLDDPALARLTSNMHQRLSREHQRAEAMIQEIQRREEEFDWQFRINDDEDDGEKDDLFDEDDEDAEGDTKMKEDQEEAPKIPNPREGWKIGDYLKFLDGGVRKPTPSTAAAAVDPPSEPTGAQPGQTAVVVA